MTVLLVSVKNNDTTWRRFKLVSRQEERLRFDVEGASVAECLRKAAGAIEGAIDYNLFYNLESVHLHVENEERESKKD